MKKILTILLLLASFNIFSQKIDTVIATNIYKSYYSFGYKQPLYVSYRLHKGGGDCPRNEFHFRNDLNIKTATNSDYKGSGYDKGHLANAEDFAYDCGKDELTFRYYNCIPQTPTLNRGIWKSWEDKIRDLSQKDSLFIITGGIYINKKTKNLYVPTHCWKIVASLTTKKILYILLFTNTANPSVTEIKLAELKKITKYKIYFDGEKIQ